MTKEKVKVPEYNPSRSFLYWLQMVCWNSIFSFIIAIQVFEETIYLMPILLGIITISGFVTWRDHKLFIKGAHHKRRQLKAGVLVMGFTQLFPMVQFAIGTILALLILPIFKEANLPDILAVYLITSGSGFMLYFFAQGISKQSLDIVNWFDRKFGKKKLVAINKDFPWKAFTNLCTAKYNDQIEGFLLKRILKMKQPPRARIGEFGEPEPKHVLIAKHPNKAEYIKVITTKKHLAEKDEDQAYLDYIAPVFDFLDTCGEEFWSIIIKSHKADYEFFYDHEQQLIYRTKVFAKG